MTAASIELPAADLAAIDAIDAAADTVAGTRYDAKNREFVNG
ncbi:hypothetical protein [Amycolatopsis minnesotensis]|uniref:FXSXX-COOH protein n=1 Tax=Amycolatopsis minnesotensis TaxID=337894 RepID=A0ABP5E7U3_9PSEU